MANHLHYDCTKLQTERVKRISNVLKQDNWPVNKSELVNKHVKRFIQFANSTDFEKLLTNEFLRITGKNTQTLTQVLTCLHDTVKHTRRKVHHI